MISSFVLYVVPLESMGIVGKREEGALRRRAAQPAVLIFHTGKHQILGRTGLCTQGVSHCSPPAPPLGMHCPSHDVTLLSFHSAPRAGTACALQAISLCLFPRDRPCAVPRGGEGHGPQPARTGGAETRPGAGQGVRVAVLCEQERQQPAHCPWHVTRGGDPADLVQELPRYPKRSHASFVPRAAGWLHWGLWPL